MNSPNIVFFFSDQQRFDTLGCNGQALDITPHLDQLAREGVNFAQAFTPQPVCGPARACLQSGRYATEIGCFRNGIPLPLDMKNTLAHCMEQNKYSLAYVGKWHLASDMAEAHYETSAIPEPRRGGWNQYWRAADLLEYTSHGYNGYVFDEAGTRCNFNGYRVDCITDYALDYIEKYDRDAPFFLFLSHIEPHHQNDHGCFEGPTGSKENYAQFSAPPDLALGEGDWELQYPDYLGCCHALDANLGRIVDLLKKKGIYENTLIVYASDHGCHFKTCCKESVEAGGYDDYKRNIYENTIHVPLIIRGPGFSGGRTETNIASLLDLPTTFLFAAGGEIPEEMQGRPLQQIQESDWDNSAYIQISESYLARCVRTQRYKYVIWNPTCNPLTTASAPDYMEKYLFDLALDPLEKNNLLGNPSMDFIRTQMQQLILQKARQAGENLVIVS